MLAEPDLGRRNAARAGNQRRLLLHPLDPDVSWIYASSVRMTVFLLKTGKMMAINKK